MFSAAIQLRRTLHRQPEISGNEVLTAERLEQFLTPLRPDAIYRGLGGYGLAVVFAGGESGPTILLRCELDALPIVETNSFDYRSVNPGISHKCGHDGHMAILAAVAQRLAAQRPDRGRVVLLFQPSEETGRGAAAVIRDPRFREIKPNYAFALHNLPGLPLGQVVLRNRVICCASRGLTVKLTGVTSHAAQPETGRSPVLALCELIPALTRLPQSIGAPGEIVLATVVGAVLGAKAFGTSPGNAELWVTLRSETDETMARLMNASEEIVRSVAASDGLTTEIGYEDVFPATVNAPEAVDIVRNAVEFGQLLEPDAPLRWSEDFGHFAAECRSVLFGIGAGENVPDLHNPDYDFPDDLIPIATDLFCRIVDECLISSL